MPEKIVNNPEKDETRKPKAERKPKRKREIKPSQMPGDVLEFDIKKGLNKYGFVHVPKKARAFLPFGTAVPLHARVDPDTETLIIKKKP